MTEFKLLRHNSKSEPCSGKAGILGKRPHLDGTGLCALALIYGVSNIFRADICFIGRIVNNDRSHGVSVIHPLLKLGLGDG